MSRNEKKGHGGEHTRPKKWSSARCPAGPATTALYYMLIAVSCVHCSDATVKHEFSEQHMRLVNYQRSLISPIAVYG